MGDNSGRQRLRPWLESKINNGQCPGLEWVDKSQGMFKIPWKHGGKQDWSETDSLIFKEWAVHTGRFREGVDKADWPSWKTRLRCALNKLPDIQEVKTRSKLDGQDPYRVYKFLPKRGPSPPHDCHSPSRESPPPSITHTSYPKLTQERHRKGGEEANIPNIITEHLSSSRSFEQYTASSTQGGHTTSQSLDSDLRAIDIKDLIRPQEAHQDMKYKDEPMDFSESCIENVMDAQNRPYSAAPSSGQPLSRSQLVIPSSGTNYVPITGLQVSGSESHEMVVKLRFRDRVVKEMVVKNTEGCRLYYGQSENSVYIHPIREQIFGSSRLLPVQFPYPDMIDDNPAQSDVTLRLLQHTDRGLLLYYKDGDIYAERKCRLAIFVAPPDLNGEPIRLERDGRPVKVFDFHNYFLPSLRNYCYKKGPLPECEIRLGFGQKWQPGFNTYGKMLISATVVHKMAQLYINQCTNGQISPAPEISCSDDYDRFLASCHQQTALHKHLGVAAT